MSKNQIRNWSHYNKALIERGSINLWFNENSIVNWYEINNISSRGRPKIYSDIAIQCALTVRLVFNLTLRQTQGFISSLVKLMGLENFEVPNYTTLCRCQKQLEVELPKSIKSDSKIHLVVDSTGFKVYGEGEWKVRQHGYSKRRTWKKLHIGVDAKTHQIEAAVITENDTADSEVMFDLLEQVEVKIKQVSADGAYDSHEIFNKINEIGAQITIPPRKDAVIKQHGNSKNKPLPRDEVLRKIKKLGRANWKKVSGYHKRSLSETAMFRLKQIFGDKFKSRLFENQGVEGILMCAALNKMTALGMPERVIVK